MRAALILAAALCVATMPATQAATPLSDEELGEIRGGFLTAEGAAINFGAVMRTFVDGSLALETQFTVGELGQVIAQQTGVADNALSLDAAAAGGLHLGSGVPANGVVIPGDGGATALIQDVSDTVIRNMIINSANNRTIVQETDITLVVPGLAALQDAVSIEQLKSALDQSVGLMLSAAALR